MTAGRKSTWIVLAGAGVGTLLALAGCARVSSAWAALRGKATVPVEDKAAPIAQGEEAPPEKITATANASASTKNSAAANASAEVVDFNPPAQPEPVKVPVVNIYGELDGREPQASAEAGDAGFQQHTYADEGYDGDVNVDRAGKWITFTSTRHTERPQIYLQRVDGTSVTQLTSDPSENAQPSFNPDGKTIAFCSTRAGSWDIYVMDIDGRNVTQVTSGPTQDMHPTFSPDGRRLAYCSNGGRSGQWEIWTVDLTTRERKMIAYGVFPSWSPDKSVDRIAFQRARQRGSRWFSLWTLDLVEGEARRTTEIAVSSNAAIINPTWSPDGRHLAFATVVDPAQTVKGRPRGQQDVWVIDADGGGRRRLTDGTSTCLGPSWASDNRVYFVSDRGGHENIWSVKTEPESALPVAENNMKNAPPAKPTPPAGKSAVGSVDPQLEN
jgi:TolB protein